MSEPEAHAEYPVARPWRSLHTVLFVQTQNAFNDNFLKGVLIALAIIAAQGQVLGKYAANILAGCIPLAFLTFSPLAGYVSDRYSKRDVLFWCIVAQLGILVLTIYSVYARSLYLGLFCLFILSVQSTFFSPSKQGILKELVGSKSLVFANGMLQMFTNLAALSGAALGAYWFGIRQKALQAGADPAFTDTEAQAFAIDNAWVSAMLPILVILFFAVLPLAMRWLVCRTPAFPTRLTPGILVAHITNMGLLFRTGPAMRKAAIGVAFYWFLATFFSVLLINIGPVMYPNVSDGDSAIETSRITWILGGGLILGGLSVAIVGRKGINLKIAVIGLITLAILLAVTAFAPLGTTPFYILFFLLGFTGMFFLVPMSSLMQDIAPNETRGKVMGASAVFVAICGLTSLGLSSFLTYIGLHPSQQMLVFVVPSLLIAWYVYPLVRIHREMRASAASTT